MTTAESIIVNRDDSEHRYEARLGDWMVAAAYYERQPDRLIFTHTETDPDYEGQGIASALARQALEDVRVRGETVIARCPFIAGYIRRHPELHDLLAAGHE